MIAFYLHRNRNVASRKIENKILVIEICDIGFFFQYNMSYLEILKWDVFNDEKHEKCTNFISHLKFFTKVLHQN